MARKRAAVLTVMGILNIVFGSLFLLCNLCAGIGLVFLFGNTGQGGLLGPAGNVISDMTNFMKTEVPAFAVLTIGEVVANLVLNVLLIIAGIGLLTVQSWGRVLSICYSILTIVIKIGSLIFTLAIVNPATERWQQDYLRRHPGIGGADAMGNNAFNSVSSVLGAVLGMAYCVVLLIMMLLPSVSAALAGRGRRDDYDLDRPEDEDEDLGRERRRPDDEWRE
jgi:hypothetical protein